MPDTVLVMHSSGPQGAGEGSDPLVNRLREELGTDYEILFPKMPGTEDAPHYAPWRDRLSEELDALEGKTILFGHSLGGSVALKYAAEGGLGDRVAGLVLVETPFWGTSDWEREWALPEGWPVDGTQLPPTFLFHSRDDEEIPFAHLDLYAQRLPEATVHPLDGTGHLLERGDLSEIVAAIRSL
jgi:predicted alpha/beta hydrolase family esterase